MIFMGLQVQETQGPDRACADKLMGGGRDGNGIHGSVSLYLHIL